ncbi:MAG: GNAT family N-acetyltransferase [Phycisphaerales bacterium]|nr:GNAT family N-acetyltransferase [Phycisphaerales bacterium]
MPHRALTETDLHLIRLHGHVEEIDGITVARIPDNPGYRWGNSLHLPAPPCEQDLDTLIAMSREVFSDQPETRHVMLRWDGAAITDGLAAHAATLGMSVDSGQVMHADMMEAVHGPDLEIRPMTMQAHREEIVALNIACDPEEIDGVDDYIEFKEGLRRAWLAWEHSGDATWWGAFIDGRLVGQAGMVRCPGGRGRFQSVETHPDFRRRSVCTTLVSTMGNHALAQPWCDTLLLGVDPLGLAIHIYDRLGFRLGQWQVGLVILPS